MSQKAIVIFDIDGVIRDVSNSYRRAIADTVDHFTQGNYRPSLDDIDQLKSEGIWNNDWKASEELIYRYFAQKGQNRDDLNLDYNTIVEFFQERYRGKNWDGYITTEPLLVTKKYLENLTKNQIDWGFFSGATRGSAEYILKQRLGLENPVLIGMEDAPGKPDPTGLFATLKQLESGNLTPVFYVGDTVADLKTVEEAKTLQPERLWVGIGILPPHVQSEQSRQENYHLILEKSGAKVVLDNVEQLTPELIENLI
jgi:HAD superfamily phosphatase